MTELSEHWGDWEVYFRALRHQRDSGEADALEDEPSELAQPWTPTLWTSAPVGVKRLAKRLTDAGWEVFCESAVTRVGKSYYKGTDRAGEVKSEAHNVITWQVRARRVQGGRMVAALLASWEQKKSCAFDYVRTWDVVTEEREFFTKLADITEWLAILAPAPEKKAKVKAA